MITQQHTRLDDLVSECCGASLRPHEGEEGTQWYTCSQCRRPTESIQLKQGDTMTAYTQQLRRMSSEDIRAAIERLDAAHYFNWSNADQVDRLMYQRELERRS